MDKSKCIGCRENFYNQPGNSNTGECWLLKSATVKWRWQTGVWTMPLSPGAFQRVRVPSCYRKQGYVYTDKPHPEAVDFKGKRLRVVA